MTRSVKPLEAEATKGLGRSEAETLASSATDHNKKQLL